MKKLILLLSLAFVMCGCVQQIGDITLLKSLGKGFFGEVFLSSIKGKTEIFATKQINRKKTDACEVRKKLLENEVRILQLLHHHPNIIRLESVKTTKENYYLVMEYANGGNLDKCLKKYKEINKKYFSEEVIQYFMRQIIDALKYIHEKKIIHRDLKLDNIMINYNNDIDKKNFNILKTDIKIIDFGASVQGDKATTIVGTVRYMPPDLLQKISNCTAIRLNKEEAYTQAVDIWSIGTACYEMLMGQIIEYSNNPKEVLKKINNGLYAIPSKISRELSSFLSSMFQPNPNKRLSAAQLANHPFLKRKVTDFMNIDTKTIINRMTNKPGKMNIKNSQSIWPVINDTVEQIILTIKDGREIIDNMKKDDISNYYKKANTEKLRINPQGYIQNNNQNQSNELNRGNNIQGQNIYMNKNTIQYNQYQQMSYPQNIGINQIIMNNNISKSNQINYPYNMINNNNLLNSGNNVQMNLNNFNPLGNSNSSNKSANNHYRPMDNDDCDDNKEGGCIII